MSAIMPGWWPTIWDWSWPSCRRTRFPSICRPRTARSGRLSTRCCSRSIELCRAMRERRAPATSSPEPEATIFSATSRPRRRSSMQPGTRDCAAHGRHFRTSPHSATAPSGKQRITRCANSYAGPDARAGSVTRDSSRPPLVPAHPTRIPGSRRRPTPIPARSSMSSRWCSSTTSSMLDIIRAKRSTIRC